MWSQTTTVRTLTVETLPNPEGRDNGWRTFIGGPNGRQTAGLAWEQEDAMRLHRATVQWAENRLDGLDDEQAQDVAESIWSMSPTR